MSITENGHDHTHPHPHPHQHQVATVDLNRLLATMLEVTPECFKHYLEKDNSTLFGRIFTKKGYDDASDECVAYYAPAVAAVVDSAFRVALKLLTQPSAPAAPQ